MVLIVPKQQLCFIETYLKACSFWWAFQCLMHIMHFANVLWWYVTEKTNGGGSLEVGCYFW